jgi:RecA-family ATPase
MTTQRTFEDTLRVFQHSSGKGQQQRGIPQTYHPHQQQPPKPWPAFVPHAELVKPLPPPEWEIEPLFNQDDRVMFYGAPGSQKSWLLMHMGICLAAGLPWLDKFGISKPRKVLWLDKEMDLKRVMWRYERMIRGLGLEDQGLPFQVWAKPPFMGTYSDIKQLLALFEEQQWKPDVMIIDSFRRVLAGDENDSNAIKKLSQSNNELCR